jgi:hypothetical protein
VAVSPSVSPFRDVSMYWRDCDPGDEDAGTRHTGRVFVIQRTWWGGRHNRRVSPEPLDRAHRDLAYQQLVRNLLHKQALLRRDK